jgi:hypothetical protein
VRRLLPIVTCIAVLGALPLSAGAQDPRKVTATVKTLSPTSRLVHIVNRDRVPYGRIVVQAIGSPRITAATKPCVIERDLGFEGTVSTWRYRATCKRSVAAGKTFDVRLTTAGKGRIVVYVVVKGRLVEIDR